METKPTKIRYFAYGSNMYTNRLRERVPSCEFFAVAILKEHILKFHKKSKDGSGKCNAYCTGNKQDEIIGVVFYIFSEDKPKIDSAEGVRCGYNEKKVKVHCGESVIETFMYEAENWAIDDSLRPYTWYKDFVVKGAKEHNLPNSYIKLLEAVPAICDTNNVRKQRNRKIIDTSDGWPIE